MPADSVVAISEAQRLSDINVLLTVVADSWEKLRPIDFHRLLDMAEEECRGINTEMMVHAIKSNRPDLGNRLDEIILERAEN